VVVVVEVPLDYQAVLAVAGQVVDQVQEHQVKVIMGDRHQHIVDMLPLVVGALVLLGLALMGLLVMVVKVEVEGRELPLLLQAVLSNMPQGAVAVHLLRRC
jgi:hypothetical protein